MSIESQRAMRDVIGLVLFEVAAVGGLHAIGTQPHVDVDWLHISRWLAATPADQVVVSLAWLCALALGWWTLGTTMLYLLTRVKGFRAGARIAERLAPAVIRRVIDRAVATTMVTSVLFGAASPALAEQQQAPLPITQQAPETLQYEPEPAGTEEAEPPSTGPGQQEKAPKPVDPPEALEDKPERQDGDGEQPQNDRNTKKAPSRKDRGADTGNTDQFAGEQEHDATASEAADRDEDTPDANGKGKRATDDRESRTDDRESRAGAGTRAAPRPGSTYTVRSGDHLWKIATQVVSANGHATDRRAVASYWATLVRATAPHLRSGDPNLIYPGETLELPPLGYLTED
jgi:LysM repeat protein